MEGRSRGIELRFHPMFGIINRLQLGINDKGFGTGWEGKLRLGEEIGTNMVLGASTAQALGTAAIIQFNWNPGTRFYSSGTMQVTNLPVGGDFGIRLIGELGFRVRERVWLAARASHNARDVQSGGLGLGLGLVYSG